MARTDVTVKGYDYSQEPDELAGKLRWCAEQLNKLDIGRIANIVETGEIYFIAHDEMSGVGRNGQFKPWVESATRSSIRSAYEYIDAYNYCQKYLPDDSKTHPDGSKKCATVAHFHAKALYLLAPEKTPEAAKKEAANLAGKGQTIRKADAQALIKKHKPAPVISVAAVRVATEPEPPKELTIEEKRKLAAKELEAFAKRIIALLKEMPDDPWLQDRDRRGFIEDQLNSAATNVRLCKGSATHESCKGKGCKACKDTGWLTRQEALAQQ